jgi:hypothetical protein
MGKDDAVLGSPLETFNEQLLVVSTLAQVYDQTSGLLMVQFEAHAARTGGGVEVVAGDVILAADVLLLLDICEAGAGFSIRINRQADDGLQVL